VGILWHKDIDSSVNIIDDGGEKIQCIEITQEHGKPIIIISVYIYAHLWRLEQWNIRIR
jgi:hypothetical protein